MSTKTFLYANNQQSQWEDHSSIKYPQFHEEDPEESEFGCRKIRTRFIRRVYYVLLVRLMITFGFVCLFVFNPSIQLFTDKNPIMAGIIIIFTAALFSFILFSKATLRSNSTNILLLGLYDFVESVLLSFVGAVYVPKIIFMTVILAIVILLVLMMLTFQSKYDLTTSSLNSWMFFILFIVEILIGAIFIQNELVKYIIACILSSLFSIYVVNYIKELINGKGEKRTSEDDFMLAALNF